MYGFEIAHIDLSITFIVLNHAEYHYLQLTIGIMLRSGT
jgi:hypothetical protein